MSEGKVCTKCQVMKPFVDFSKNKKGLLGLKSRCKACMATEKAEWAKNNKTHIAEYNAQWRENNPQYHGDWRADNKDRVNQLEMARYYENHEKYLAKRKRLYEVHAEKRRAYQAKKHKESPWLKAFYMSVQKASRLNCMPRWADREAIKQIYKRKYELELELGITLHVDHIIPLKHKLVSGLHYEGNLQILTASENSKKNNYLEIADTQESINA